MLSEVGTVVLMVGIAAVALKIMLVMWQGGFTAVVVVGGSGMREWGFGFWSLRDGWWDC